MPRIPHLFGRAPLASIHQHDSELLLARHARILAMADTHSELRLLNRYSYGSPIVGLSSLQQVFKENALARRRTCVSGNGFS